VLLPVLPPKRRQAVPPPKEGVAKSLFVGRNRFSGSAATVAVLPVKSPLAVKVNLDEGVDAGRFERYFEF
jgi:hypothetical protein